MISWERMVQREHETRTRGCVAWSLAVCAEDRAKPVMDACLYICSNICGVQRLFLTHHRYAGPIRGGRHHAPPPQRGAMGIGQDGQGPHPVGMAPSLIREHLLSARTLRVCGDVKPNGRSDPLHLDTDPQI